MLTINKETAQTPDCTYVNGCFNGKQFEFTFHRGNGEFEFGTRPNIGGVPIECEPLSADEQKELAVTWLDWKNNTVLPVPYVYVGDDGIEIEATADVDIRTGEVTNVMEADVSGRDVCELRYIVMNDEQVDVYKDEHGYDYWADIEGVYGSMSDDTETTTQCVNGILKSGDLVISTPSDEYSCLIGLVGTINLAGTPEHDEETENETDDVHVDFTGFGYSDRRVAEIEEMFSSFYNEPKEFEDCPIDDVIMPPGCLIRITGINNDTLKELLDSGFEAACYCYSILAELTPPTGQPDGIISAESDSDLSEPLADEDKIKEKIFNAIDSAVALAGFKVLDGDKDSVFIRHSESDTDFEIKVCEIPG